MLFFRNNTSSRIHRQYLTDITHLNKGTKNYAPVTLSRISVNGISSLPEVDLNEMATHQDVICEFDSADSSLKFYGFDKSLIINISDEWSTLFCPDELVSNVVRSLSHPGIRTK